MTFSEMKQLDGELARLEASARFAGSHGASWGEWWAAADQALTKAVGAGAICEELQHWRFYEMALDALHKAWKRGRKSESLDYESNAQPTFPREKQHISADCCQVCCQTTH